MVVYWLVLTHINPDWEWFLMVFINPTYKHADIPHRNSGFTH